MQWRKFHKNKNQFFLIALSEVKVDSIREHFSLIE